MWCKKVHSYYLAKAAPYTMEELHWIHGLALFIAAVAGLAIAHYAVLRLPTGLPRLTFVLPILPIFFLLPWTIPIYHLRAILSFIFLWTVPSKLFLLCWDAGIDYPSSGFLYFATIVMMPIRVRGKARKQATCIVPKRQFWWQFIAVIFILNIYSYRNGLHIWAIYVLYACHMYLGLELMLGGLAKLATSCFGVETDPQFNNPFMSASLSEFWGRRWNLVVTTILRSTVYKPALLLLTRAEKQKFHQSRAPESSCASKASLLSDEYMSTDACMENHPANMSTDAKMESMHTDEMKSSIASDKDSLAREPLPQIQETAESSSLLLPLSRNVIDPDSLQPMITCRPNHAIHPLCVEPTEGIQPARLPIANTAANSTDARNPDFHTCNFDSRPELECNPQNASFLACRPGRRSTQHINMARHLSHTLNAITCPSANPKINHGASKLTPRASTVAMLTAATEEEIVPAATRLDPINQEIAPIPRSEVEAKNTNMMRRGEEPSLKARAMAMLVTFAVSGLVHELIFYYINKSKATGEVTAFFILHGCATAAEVLLKKTMLAQLRLPRPISIALTLAFLYATAAWLFMPPLTRYGADINTIAEYQRLQSALISLIVPNKKKPVQT